MLRNLKVTGVSLKNKDVITSRTNVTNSILTSEISNLVGIISTILPLVCSGLEPPRVDFALPVVQKLSPPAKKGSEVLGYVPEVLTRLTCFVSQIAERGVTEKDRLVLVKPFLAEKADCLKAS